MIDSRVDAQQVLLLKSLRDLARRTTCSIAFGGLTVVGVTPLSGFIGARGTSLSGLVIQPAEGVGGLAVSNRRPVAATHYRRSSRITHRYDREVSAEGIVSLLALPVVVDRRVVAVVYSGNREATRFGDTVVRAAMQTAKSLEWELSVHAEVDRRLAALESDGRIGTGRSDSASDRQELRAAFAMLRDLGRSVPDADLADRIDAIARLVLPSPPVAGGPGLSPRQVDVLAEVALGKRNAQIGAHLSLTESTVKSYVASAMRKLGASSRYEAVVAARTAGLLP